MEAIFEIIKSIVYGIVEGITEWLPISSTGHLVLLKKFMPLNVTNEFWDMYEVVIQFGAILAVVAVFWWKIWPFYTTSRKHARGTIIKSSKDPVFFSNCALSMDAFWMWVKIAVACIPAVAYGVLFDDKVTELFNKSIPGTSTTIEEIVVIAMIFIVGILFIIIENHNKKLTPKTNSISNITYKAALFIGVCQLVAAALPGTSRSGATILGALMIGIARTAATEFTFFLAIPVMFGASLLKGGKFCLAIIGGETAISSTEIWVLVVGTVVSFVISIFAIKFLVSFIKKNDFKGFGYYRIILGAVLLAYLAATVLL